MKAILIARVSTEEQKEMGNSLPAQVARLERYCQIRGYTILKTCSFDESAYTEQRNEFDRIIDFILQQKETVAVCCDKVDRISRNIFDKRISLLYEKALRDEIELHFISDNQIINSSICAVDKFKFAISLGLSKYFSDAISDNVKRATEQKIRRGEWPARAPYGYQNITRPDGKNDIIVDEYKAAIIQKIFELYATGAFSMLLLCKKIKEDFSLNWSKGYLDHVLKNEFYMGIMTWKGASHPHRYPPIINTTLFNQVQNMKTRYNKKTNNYNYAGKPYIYRGMIRCADCSLAITPEKHKGHVYYHCTQSKGKHGAAWVREEEITRQLEDVFRAIQLPSEAVESILQTLNEVHLNKIEFQNKQFDEITKDQKTFTRMLDSLYLDRLKGRITETEYDRYHPQIRSQLEEATATAARLQEAEDNYYMTAKNLVNLVNHAHDLFVGSEVEEKRQLIKLVLSNLTLKDKTLVYEAHMPFNILIKNGDSQTWCAR